MVLSFRENHSLNIWRVSFGYTGPAPHLSTQLAGFTRVGAGPPWRRVMNKVTVFWLYLCWGLLRGGVKWME